MSKDDRLSYLLDLDGEILVQAGGYWVKIEAHTCEASPQVPHGISYSLTLHDRYGISADRICASVKSWL